MPGLAKNALNFTLTNFETVALESDEFLDFSIAHLQQFLDEFSLSYVLTYFLLVFVHILYCICRSNLPTNFCQLNHMNYALIRLTFIVRWCLKDFDQREDDMKRILTDLACFDCKKVDGSQLATFFDQTLPDIVNRSIFIPNGRFMNGIH